MKNIVTGTCKRCDAPLHNGKLRCSACGLWNVTDTLRGLDETILLSKVTPSLKRRMPTGPWDFLFGPTKPPYGLSQMSTNLIGGNRGSGKSTFALHLANGFAHYNDIPAEGSGEIIYLAAEEALDDIYDRGVRLKLDKMDFIRMIPAMSGAVDISRMLNTYKPGLMIVDSLQGLVGEDDALSIEICRILKRWAVDLKAPVVILNHLTKDGEISGLNTVQHAVDGVYLMSADEDTDNRTIEVHKNRNGKAFISCEFEMGEEGLKVIPNENNNV